MGKQKGLYPAFCQVRKPQVNSHTLLTKNKHKTSYLNMYILNILLGKNNRYVQYLKMSFFNALQVRINLLPNINYIN